MVLRHPWSITLLLLAGLALAASPSRKARVPLEPPHVRYDRVCPEAPTKAPSGAEPDVLESNTRDVPWAVSVTPDGGSASWTENTTNHTATFTVTNTGDCNDGYSFTRGMSGPVTNVRLDKTGATVFAHASTTVTATYDVGAAGGGQLTLSAGSANSFDDGHYNVTATLPPYVVAVTPDGTPTPSRSSNSTGFTDTFTVRNAGSSVDSYTITCGGMGVTCTGTSPTSITNLASGASQLVTAQYSTGAVGTDTLTLIATSTHTSDGGSRSVPIVKATVAVTPDGPADPQRRTGEAYADTFTVRNTGTGTTSFTVTVTCTGAAIASGCVASPSSLSLGGGVQGSVGVSYTAGPATSTGRITLRATQTADATVLDTGWVTLAVGTAQKPVVDVTSANPGTTRARGLCLTIAAGAAAAAECGDLRIVHPLPSVRTLDRLRAPTLIYNSAEARPYPLVAANVSLPTTAANPDTVYATLKAGAVTRGTAKWSGVDWNVGSASRIVVADTTNPDSTGIYSYTLIVTNWWNGTPTVLADTQAVKVPVVARQKSPFGAGWWLAGVERLYPASMLWVGGDGSTRQYAPAGTNVWAAPNVDRPDTLKFDGTFYTRYVPHGARVQFDQYGRHVATINRLGHTTKFGYKGTTDTLLADTLPPTGLVYQFVYTPGQRWVVTAPSVTGQTRADTGTIVNGRLTAVRGPDTSRVSFAYLAGVDSNLVQTRTDRRGYPTTYTLDAGKKLTQSSLNMGGGQPAIVRQWRPLETFGYPVVGASRAPDTAAAYARYDGPRVPTDVGDTTLFWLDRYGQPQRVRNALGDTTRFTRADSRWPALVTRLARANGQVVGATYDDHGNVTSATDSSTSYTIFSDPPVRIFATTRYVWNRTWDFDSIVAPPEGDSLVMSYSASNGNRAWQQDARGSVSRVSFGYNTLGLLVSISEPGICCSELVTYDRLGNDSIHATPLGITTLAFRDAIGRVTSLIAPSDTLATGRDTTNVYYDVSSRDTLTTRFGAARTYTWPYMDYTGGLADRTFTTPSQTLTVGKAYDPEGLLTSLSRTATPDINLISTTTTSWIYDGARRRVRETSPSGVDTLAYDPAGNVIQWFTRRGHTIVNTYDALNRLIARVKPPTTNFWWRPGAGIWCFPRYASPCDNVTQPGDMAVFGYDSVGNLTRADNGDALIRRGYNRNGTVAGDTLIIQPYVGRDSTQHVYGLTYGYDLDGRRVSLKHPATVAPRLGSTVMDNVGYSYAVNGQLASVTDMFGNVVRWVYDAAGRPDTMFYPGQIYQAWDYDADSRVIRRVVHDTLFGNSPDSGFVSGSFRFPYMYADTLMYDTRAKLIIASTTDKGMFDAYTGLGSLVRSGVAVKGMDQGNEEGYEPDALGNNRITWTEALPKSGNVTSDSNHTVTTNRYAAQAALIASSYTGSGGLPDTTSYTFDEAGSVWLKLHRRAQGVSVPLEGMATYRDASQQVRVVDRRGCITPDGYHCDYTLTVPYYLRGTYEEYRYDALGRRILVRSRADSSCAAQHICESVIKRTVWDGDQVLYEIQYPGGDTIAVPLLERDTGAVFTTQAPHKTQHYAYGRVVYVNGAGVDQPLAVIRINYDSIWPGPVALFAHANWRGVFDVGSFDNGASTRCKKKPDGTNDPLTCITPSWDGIRGGSYFQGPYDSYNGPTAWFGDVPQLGRDATGLMYRRNRYYDPTTGRFTQEDPIGLAGGLNLYGFAAGDPVNFADPFGLKVCFGERDRPRLVRGVEKATSTSITLDKAGCVSSFEVHKKEGFEGQQARFAALVDREATYMVVSGDLQRSGEYDGNTNTATVDFSQLKRDYYPISIKGQCLPIPIAAAKQTLGALLAHELAHAYYGVSDNPRVDEQVATFIAENEYHYYSNESLRCAYDVDLSH